MTATTSLAQALLAFQAKGAKFQKDKINPGFKNSKYASTDAILTDLLPIANECGLVIVQMPTHVDGQPALTTRLIHADSGEAVESTMLLLSKPDPQGQGAGLTYARRYAITAFLGLSASEDTDGVSPRSAAGTAEPRRETRAEAPDPGAPSPANGTTKYATEPQRKRLFALAKENNVDTARLKEILEKITGQGSTAQIPRDKYDAVCVAVQTAELAASLADVPFS